MAGLAVGSMWMTRWLRHREGSARWLQAVEVALLAYCGIAALALRGLFSAQAPWLLTLGSLLLMNIMAGICVGLEFPLANRLLLRQNERLARIAGYLYAVDLIGAFIASLAVPVLLIPIVGTLSTCWALVALKLGSLVLVRTLAK